MAFRPSILLDRDGSGFQAFSKHFPISFNQGPAPITRPSSSRFLWPSTDGPGNLPHEDPVLKIDAVNVIFVRKNILLHRRFMYCTGNV